MSDRRTALELVAILLVAIAGVVLGVQQSRTSDELDELNATVLGTQVLRCTNDMTDVSKLDPTVSAICARAIAAVGGRVPPITGGQR